MSRQLKDIDLHLHTTASDGTSTVEELLQDARDAGLAAIAITDHDNINAIDRAIEIGQDLGIEVITGIELSATFEDVEVHILGYLFDHQQPQLLEKLAEIQTGRMERLGAIIEKLQNLDVPIELEEVLELVGSGSPGRLHIARVLCNKRIVKDIHEAFYLYLGYGKKAYIERALFSADDAIRMIRKSNGIPVIAHPASVHDSEFIRRMTHIGLLGIEAYYPSFSISTRTELTQLASALDLIVTGGSDCHGKARGPNKTIGTFKVPYELLQIMKERKTTIQECNKNGA
ncbi:MAG: PHP domain-containing protein [Chlamydiota bacterium]|nr:PHP domain-containing protein [Chlamydiota bacterium]